MAYVKIEKLIGFMSMNNVHILFNSIQLSIDGAHSDVYNQSEQAQKNRKRFGVFPLFHFDQF